MTDAIAAVPPGPWAVGVSGGADSVALLTLLRTRPDVSLIVVHLDHQTRGDASATDAEFVRKLADGFGVPSILASRNSLEHNVADLPANPSARYRRLRHALFARTIADHSLNGVILAHHADDQAETVLQRLLRGSSYAGLAGMRFDVKIDGLRILRPLLSISRAQLRQHLHEIAQPWREDASNASTHYQRNRVRLAIADEVGLRDALLELARAAGVLRDWAESSAVILPDEFAAAQLADQPEILARQSAARWLIARGVHAAEMEPAVIDRLLTLAGDAASPGRVDFPSGVRAVRRKSKISARGR